MSKFFKTTLFFISVMFFASCSSDDNISSSTDDDGGPETPTAQTFTLDGETYQVNQAALQIINDLEAGISDTTISLIGLNTAGKVGTISFWIIYETSDGIEGIYSSDEDDWEQVPGTYSSWLSNYSIVTQNQNMENSNQPLGPVKIISHGDNVYTLEFDVTYANDVTATGSVKKTFTVQTSSF
jgi:hypothetical protein